MVMTLEDKIEAFIKGKLKINQVDKSKVFQDGYTIYYDDNYVGNASHLF